MLGSRSRCLGLPPEPLLSWITDHLNEPHAKELYKYIHAYNTVFALASIVVEHVNPEESTGLPRLSGRISTGASNAADANQSFRINETIYHRIGRLRSTDGSPLSSLRKWFSTTPMSSSSIAPL